MIPFLVLLLVLAAAGIAGTVHAVRTDGYGPRPDRADRFTPARPI